MSEDINHHRRRFLGTTAMTIAAAHLGMVGSAQAQSDETTPKAFAQAVIEVEGY